MGSICDHELYAGLISDCVTVGTTKALQSNREFMRIATRKFYESLRTDKKFLKNIRDVY